jgi:hypothetical protein
MEQNEVNLNSNVFVNHFVTFVSDSRRCAVLHAVLLRQEREIWNEAHLHLNCITGVLTKKCH